MRHVVAYHAQRLRIAAGHEPDGGIALDGARKVLDTAVHRHGQRGARQTRPDALGQLRPGDRAVEAGRTEPSGRVMAGMAGRP